tara:strand:+ start:150 stop:884 length:735 start_codon:yes stop_codon:yes gene_type:complete
MGFTEAVASAFSKYFRFSGRALRSEYSFFFLFNIIMFIIAVAIGDLFPQAADMFLSFYALLVLFPSLAVTSRRLHDMNESGWKWLFLCVPFVNIYIILLLMIKKGDTNTNRFGAQRVVGRDNPEGSGGSFVFRIIGHFLKGDRNKKCAWCGSTKIKFKSGNEGNWYWEHQNKDGSKDKRVKNNFQSAGFHSEYECNKCSATTKFTHFVDRKPSEKVGVWKRVLVVEGQGEKKGTDWTSETAIDV